MNSYDFEFIALKIDDAYYTSNVLYLKLQEAVSHFKQIKQGALAPEKGSMRQRDRARNPEITVLFDLQLLL